jgi:Spy/CpxP family protein refolding chaperone
MKTRLLAGVVLASIPTLALAQSTSPYAGQQTRDIKTLSSDEVKSYLTGEGLGMAKAGELNHYPGPKHVLDMADRLGLTADQKQRIASISAAMTAAAVQLGREIVAGERTLNVSFAAGTIDDAALAAQTGRIGNLQGRLRDVHLSAHLATRRVLTASQVARYDAMRGYSSSGGMNMQDHHM